MQLRKLKVNVLILIPTLKDHLWSLAISMLVENAVIPGCFYGMITAIY